MKQELQNSLFKHRFGLEFKQQEKVERAFRKTHSDSVFSGLQSVNSNGGYIEWTAEASSFQTKEVRRS